MKRLIILSILIVIGLTACQRQQTGKTITIAPELLTSEADAAAITVFRQKDDNFGPGLRGCVKECSVIHDEGTRQFEICQAFCRCIHNNDTFPDMVECLGRRPIGLSPN